MYEAGSTDEEVAIIALMYSGVTTSELQPTQHWHFLRLKSAICGYHVGFHGRKYRAPGSKTSHKLSSVSSQTSMYEAWTSSTDSFITNSRIYNSVDPNDENLYKSIGYNKFRIFTDKSANLS